MRSTIPSSISKLASHPLAAPPQPHSAPSPLPLTVASTCELSAPLSYPHLSYPIASESCWPHCPSHWPPHLASGTVFLFFPSSSHISLCLDFFHALLTILVITATPVGLTVSFASIAPAVPSTCALIMLTDLN